MADEITETPEATPETAKPKRTRKPAVDINAPTPGYTGPTGNRFVMVSEPRTVKPDGQIPAIVRAMKSAGRKGFTAESIATAVAAEIKTVQTPLRVVRYYVSEWRKRKHIKPA